MGIIGDLRDLRGEVVNFEWKIKDFLQLSNEVDTCYESPEFSFRDSSWEIWIYPNGQKTYGTVEFIGLYVISKSLKTSISVNYSLHFETVDGKADTNAKFTSTYIFKVSGGGWGSTKFISRSKLIEKKSDLLPSGVLTVICTLKTNGTNDGAAGYATVDEFTQTEEKIGVLKLQQHFSELLQNGNASDVVLKVADQEFKSHRCVLAARSPVFLAMMTHETKEKNTGIVDIEDAEPNTFSDFLKYLYTGNEEIITQDNMIKLYTAADKYQVGDLKKSCLDYMLTNMSVDNFCDILSLSLMHVEQDLTEACSQFFIKNSLAIILTPKWLTFLGQNLVAGNELLIKHLKNK